MVDAKKWLLLALSVGLYGLAFLMSRWFFWTVFFFLVPLYYCACTKTLSFKEGYFYGFFQWALAGWGVLASITHMAQGSLVIRIIPSIAILAYEGLFSGLWFLITNRLIAWLRITSIVGRLLIWICTTMLYIIWVVHYSFSIFNYIEGYFLMHPLLPLIEHPPLLSLLVPLGKGVVTLFLCITNAIFTVPLLLKRRWYIAGLACIPWLISLAMAPAPLAVPGWVHKIAYIPHSFKSQLNLTPLGEAVQRHIRILLKEYPKTEVIILPESAFDRVNLETAHEIGQYWNREHVSKPLHLVIGAFHWDNKKIHNAAYWLYDGTIQAIFRKRHAMLLVEAVAPWYDLSFLRNLYHPIAPVSPSDNKRIAFTFFENKPFVPYICSELFFNDTPDDAYTHVTILALCNDTWTVAPYISYLMLLAARFKALEWQRDMVYISYLYGNYIDKNGAVTPLHH